MNTKLKSSQIFVVLIDFDECLVVEHASKNFTLSLFPEASEEDFHDPSPGGLFKLLKGYCGVNRSVLNSTAEKIALNTNIKAGAIELLSVLSSLESIKPIIVSSGLDFVIKKILELNGLNLTEIDIVASSLAFNGEVCIGAGEIVSSEYKGKLTQAVVEIEKIHTVFAIGHSTGDIEMLKAANVSIVVDPVDPSALKIADYYANSMKEVQNIIINIVNKINDKSLKLS